MAISVGSGSSRLLPVTTKSAAATLTVAEDGLILVSAAVPYTLTLPTAVGNTGLRYHFIKTDANYNLITLDGNGTETFNYPNDASAAQTTYRRLNTYGAEVTIVSDGSNWQVINEELGQSPSCWVWSSVNITDLPNGLDVLVDLDSEVSDVGNNFNSGTWVTGNANTDTTSHLVDTVNNQFAADMVGKRVKNVTDSTYAFITAYNSTSDLTLSADIFPDGIDEYIILVSRFVVPVDGKYAISGKVLWWNVVANTYYRTKILRNGSVIMESMIHTSNTNFMTVPLVDIISLSKDDYLQLVATSNSGDDTVDLLGGINNRISLHVQLISKD